MDITIVSYSLKPLRRISIHGRKQPHGVVINHMNTSFPKNSPKWTVREYLLQKRPLITYNNVRSGVCLSTMNIEFEMVYLRGHTFTQYHKQAIPIRSLAEDSIRVRSLALSRSS